MSLAMFMAVFAIAFVAVGVSLIVGLDGRLAGGGRFATAALRPTLPGLRARHREEHKASPALFLLGSVLLLLVVATLV